MLKGILLDYGGTIDTNGRHWGEVLWNAYVKNNVPVTKDDFRKAYSYAERALAINAYIKPTHIFYDVLHIKLELQFQFLVDNNDLPKTNWSALVNSIANDCNSFAAAIIEEAKPVLSQIASRYPMVLVSNFYGNIHAVLAEFGLSHFFQAIVESAVVGVRKPDHRIFELGVKAIGLEPGECVVIGDSYGKDIAPGKKAGCKTIWLKGEGWGDDPADTSQADLVIKSFSELPGILQGGML